MTGIERRRRLICSLCRRGFLCEADVYTITNSVEIRRGTVKGYFFTKGAGSAREVIQIAGALGGEDSGEYRFLVLQGECDADDLIVTGGRRYRVTGVKPVGGLYTVLRLEVTADARSD
ncbi:MAG: hypothetical protein IIZ68_02650 [Clostridia bacterium]|nr:hypothetical protein [Clostridia bacterium]